MNKQKFLEELRKGLSNIPGLPRDEVEERLSFYGEMLDDRTEEGLSEEAAVSAVGSVDEIISLTVSEIPLAKIAKERIKPKRRLKTWEIVCLILGSPVWISLLIAAFAVILSVYIVLWSVLISLWSVFIAFVCGALGCIAWGIALSRVESVLAGIAAFAAALVCAGFSVFTFYGCKSATGGILRLTGKIAVLIKSGFIGRKKEQ